MFQSSEESHSKYDIPRTYQNGDLVIGGIVFASSDDISDPLKESGWKTEIWTLTDRLKSISNITPAPKLKASNWKYWCDSIQKPFCHSQFLRHFLKCPPQ